jgi:hypothetical protein
LSISAARIIDGFDIQEGRQLSAEPCPYFRIDTVADAGAFDGSLNEAGVFQFFEVLRDGGLCQSEFIHDVSADAFVTFEEGLQDGDPGGVGHGFEHGGQFVLFGGEDFGFGGAHIHRNITINNSDKEHSLMGSDLKGNFQGKFWGDVYRDDQCIIIFKDVSNSRVE